MFDNVKVDLAAVEALYKQKLNLKDFKIAMKHIAPETYVVEPEAVVTMELRGDHSRFFPTYDDQQRVIGGSFQ